MRQADDLSDDESLPREPSAACRVGRAGFGRLASRAEAGAAPRSDPGLHRAPGCATPFCHTALSLLDQLVQGTATDLEPAPGAPAAHPVAGALATYATFADLYRYCYLVASVVGLVCIRIFGYQRSGRRKARGRNRHRLSVDKYSARCAGRCRARPSLSAARRFWSAADIDSPGTHMHRNIQRPAN